MSEGWTAYPIAELVEEDRPICYGVLKPGDYCDHGIPLLRIVDVEGDRLSVEKLHRISPALDREFYRSKLSGGELVISIQGTIGRIALIPNELSGANISRTLARLSIKQDHSPDYIRYVFVSEAGQRLLADSVMGTTRDSLNIGALRKIEIQLPPKPTQRRIATILTTLDEVIDATEKLVEKHQQIKAGLMHDLFTRGLWTRPELARGDHKGLPSEASAKEGQLRPTPEEAPGLFQDSPLGLIPKAWKVCSLDSVSEFVTSGSRGWAQFYSIEGSIFLRIGNLTREHINLRLEDMVRVNPPESSEGNRTAVQSGDLLISITADLVCR